MRFLLLFSWLLVGHVGYAHGDLDERIAALDARIAATPRDAQLYLKRGQLHAQHRAYAFARSDYRTARRFDAALVISQDTDLLEPMRIVRERLGKPVGVAWLDSRQPGRRHVKATSFQRHVRPDMLARCQFPTRVMTKTGRHAIRPDGW